MTKQEFDQLIQRTTAAIEQVDSLIAESQQVAEGKLSEAEKERSKAQVEDNINLGTGGTEFSPVDNDADRRKEKAAELEAEANRLQNEIIKRLEREKSELENGLNELRKMESVFDDILRRANGWGSALDNIIRDVESEQVST